MPKGLDKLSTLMHEADKPLSAAEQQQLEADEAAFLADVDRVLKYATQAASKTAGEEASIFDVQALIEGCAESLREQIRDEVEGEEEDEDER
jgi:hypothetical protein